MSLRFLLDRTAVLFLGVAAGAAIGYAFGTGNETKQAVVLAPEAAPVQGAPPADRPPPPAAPAAPQPLTPAPAPSGTKPAPAVVAEPTALAPVADDQSHLQLDSALRNGRTIRVGVFGDSFGDGVWSALYRLLPSSAGYRVIKYSQQSTGFTRYQRLNLEQKDEAQIGDQPVDVAVISFGANDAQGVCDQGHCGALMSARWQRIIGARVTSYVAMLRRHGAAIYWVGLPAMRDPGFDGDATAMNAFYRALMARLNVPFFDIRPLTVDPAGHYEAYYSDRGGAKLLRANDGVHMSMNGYLRISRAVADHIRDSVKDARAMVASAPPVIQAPPAPVATASAIPVLRHLSRPSAARRGSAAAAATSPPDKPSPAPETAPADGQGQPL